MPKILMWDIESTSLNATFGTILCIGWKFMDEDKVYVRTIIDRRGKDMLNDKHVVEAFAEAFNECDYHVTWYGDRFDLPMVNSKLIRHGLHPLPPKPSIDLWKTARKRFKLHSNRLAVWQSFLGTADEKTPLDFDAWLKAAHGDKESIALVKDHCEKDVLVLEEVFKRMRPWLDVEPVAQLFGADKAGCTSCGSTNIHRRGFKVAATRTYQQFQCQDCGHWFRGTKAVDATTTRNAGTPTRGDVVF